MPILTQIRFDLQAINKIISQNPKARTFTINGRTYNNLRAHRAYLHKILHSELIPPFHFSPRTGINHFPSLEELKAVTAPLPPAKYTVHAEKNPEVKTTGNRTQVQLFDGTEKPVLTFFVDEQKAAPPTGTELEIKKVKSCFLTAEQAKPALMLRSIYYRCADKDTTDDFRVFTHAAYFNRLLGRTGYAFKKQNEIFLLTEHMPGTALAQIEREKIVAMPVQKRIQLALTLIHEIAVLHKHGFQHNLINPENVVLNDTTLKLLTLESVRADEDFIHSRTYVPAFLDAQSNDSFNPVLGLNKQSDIYALGLTLSFLFPDLLEPRLVERVATTIPTITKYQTYAAYFADKYKDHTQLANFVLTLIDPPRDKRPSIDEVATTFTNLLTTVYHEKPVERATDKKASQATTKSCSDVLAEIEIELSAYSTRQQQLSQQRKRQPLRPLYRVPTTSMHMVEHKALNPTAVEVGRFYDLIRNGHLDKIKKMPLAELRIKLFWPLGDDIDNDDGTRAAKVAAEYWQNDIALYFIDCFPELLHDKEVGVAALLRCLEIGSRHATCNYTLAIELINRGIDPHQIHRLTAGNDRGETLLTLGMHSIGLRYRERYRFLYCRSKEKFWFKREKIDDAALIKQLEDDRTRFIALLTAKKVDLNYPGIVDNGNALFTIVNDHIPMRRVDYPEFAFNRNCQLLLDAGADPCSKLHGNHDEFNTTFLAALRDPQSLVSIKLMYAKACELHPGFNLANVELYSTQLLLNRALVIKPRVETAIFILENGGTIDLTKKPVGTSIAELCDYVTDRDALIDMELINRLAELLIANGENIQPGLEKAEKEIARFTARLAEEEEKDKTRVRASFHRRTGLFAPQTPQTPQKKSDPRIERLMNYVQFITEMNAKYVTTTYQALPTFSADVSRLVSQYVGHNTRNIRYPT